MQISEIYRAMKIEIFTSMLSSGHASFVIYIDGAIHIAEIDGPDVMDTAFAAMKRAKREVDKRLASQP